MTAAGETAIRTVLHVDMDAFFASVEQRDHPAWRGRPVIVGSDPHERGVVSTCSYEARKYGVHSAMPSRTAFKLCPEGVFVRPRMNVYQTVSEQVFEIVGHFSPIVEHVSIDEAFLDVTGTIHLFESARDLGMRLRDEVRKTCGLSCSVGLAPNRLLAKIGSETAKPNGLFVMPFEPGEIRAWLAPRPVGVLWGVGRKTGEVLVHYGYRTCGDLQRADPRFLERILGSSAAASIQAHACGFDTTRISGGPRSEKSVSREYTFLKDESCRETVRAALLELSGEVVRRFRTEKRWARTGKLKFRDGLFNTVTRQAGFDLPARDDISFRRLALDLFDREWPPGTQRTVRLIGFGVTNITFSDGDPGASLFPSPNVDEMEKRERLADVLDLLGPKLQSGGSLTRP